MSTEGVSHSQYINTPERNSLSLPQVVYISHLINGTYLDKDGPTNLSQLIRNGSELIVNFIPKVVSGYCIPYIRDAFQVFDDLVIASSQEAIAVTRELIQAEIPIHLSKLGIGGCVLRSGRLILIPDSFKEEETIPELKKRGFQIDFLPVPLSQAASALGRRMSFNNHLDTEINIVQKPQGGWVFVVNDEYYREYEDRVSQLLQRYQSELIIIQDCDEQTRRRAVNFIELPDGKIVLPENCTQTKTALEGVLGVSNVLGARVDSSKLPGSAITFVNGRAETLYFHGGLRCLTNCVYRYNLRQQF